MFKLKFFSDNFVAQTISKISLYLLIFLLPIFFLPWSSNVLDFNKQALLVFLTFISLFSWLVQVLISGKVSFRLSGIYLPLAVLLLIVLASSITSLWQYGSFWGWPLVSNESFLTILSLVILSFLIITIFEKEEVLRLFKVFIVSWFLAVLVAILQIFGKFIFPFNFAKSISFNTIGTVFSIAIISAALMPVIFFLLVNSKRLWKLFLIIYLVVNAFFLILVNFLISWLVLIGAGALVIILGALKKDSLEPKWMALPMFFLAVPLLFILFRFQVAGLPPVAQEVFLRAGTTFDIVKKVIQERPLFGSGPGTFVYDFSKFKKPELNLGIFWDVRFESGNSKIANVVATTGILGALSWLFLWIMVGFYGFRFFFKKEEIGKKWKKKEGNEPLELRAQEGPEERISEALSSGLFAGIIVLTFAFFFYSSNLTLDFVYFLLIASFISLNFGTRKEFLLKPSSLPTLCVTFAFTLVFILGLGFGILESQRMVAEAKFIKGIQDFQAGKTDSAIRNLERAVILSSGRGQDLYLRELSQVYFRKLNEEATRKDISEEEISKNVQLLMSNSINSAKSAADLNPKNVANWENLGAVYQAMIGVIRDSEDWATKAYEEALKLEPTNPFLVNQKGVILLRKSELLPKEMASEKSQLLVEAQIQFEKALQLKSDYFLPHLNLAILFQLKGKQEEAIKEFELAKNLSNDPRVIFQLGLLYYRNKDYSKAQREFEMAISLDPNYANALYFLGLVYDIQGQKQKAIEKFTKVGELNPNVEEIKKILENLRAGKSALFGIATEEQSVVPPQEPEKEKLPVEKSLPVEKPKK